MARTTILVEKDALALIQGNRSEFVRAAIASKLNIEQEYTKTSLNLKISKLEIEKQVIELEINKIKEDLKNNFSKKEF